MKSHRDPWKSFKAMQVHQNLLKSIEIYENHSNSMNQKSNENGSPKAPKMIIFGRVFCWRGRGVSGHRPQTIVTNAKRNPSIFLQDNDALLEVVICANMEYQRLTGNEHNVIFKGAPCAFGPIPKPD